MFKPTKNQEKLGEYLKGKDFDRDIKLGICLCCDTDKQAEEILSYCEANPKLQDYEILQKALEISNKL